MYHFQYKISSLFSRANRKALSLGLVLALAGTGVAQAGNSGQTYYNPVANEPTKVAKYYDKLEEKIINLYKTDPDFFNAYNSLYESNIQALNMLSQAGYTLHLRSDLLKLLQPLALNIATKAELKKDEQGVARWYNPTADKIIAMAGYCAQATFSGQALNINLARMCDATMIPWLVFNTKDAAPGQDYAFYMLNVYTGIGKEVAKYDAKSLGDAFAPAQSLLNDYYEGKVDATKVGAFALLPNKMESAEYRFLTKAEVAELLRKKYNWKVDLTDASASELSKYNYQNLFRGI
ncbi:hypothetical protein [Psittacicella hinzii]|uniref:Uncharacterized protein n=1 Tax=Psittacicella hinzii TaxID=2028575 RepID=A0A3A1YPX2_9GAMM|nr:hypothetical protein [Psittacicella hinzii]RIY39299.1 hypothetical protein CKF58_02340 [Psittacicella hinzii]